MDVTQRCSSANPRCTGKAAISGGYHRTNDQGFAQIVRFMGGICKEVDEAIADVVDANAPVEMVELQRELNTNGYDLILAGDDRDEQNIEAQRAKIRKLSGEDLA